MTIYLTMEPKYHSAVGPTRCTICNRPIKDGTRFAWDKYRGNVHEGCWRKARGVVHRSRR